MVATIIAILAMIVLPLFRKRTEDAKLVAAQDDMRGLRAALVLANADSDKWFRLQDLDNSSIYNEPAVNPDEEVPIAVWNRQLTFTEREALSTEDRWIGPYDSVSRYVYLFQINTAYAVPTGYSNLQRSDKPWLFRNRDGGPILDLAADSSLDKIPTDPWGNPYLFFGPGQLGESPGSETDFSNAIIYSMGPNGVPGDITTGITNASNYTREAGYLGKGDDLSLAF
jgi:type II secretory pathway pseudopilin PulG